MTTKNGIIANPDQNHRNVNRALLHECRNPHGGFVICGVNEGYSPGRLGDHVMAILLGGLVIT